MKTFKVWIKERINDDTPIGDLARDIYQDPDFPLEVEKYEILDYLEEKGASYLAINAFEEAWSQFIDDLIEWEVY